MDPRGRAHPEVRDAGVSPGLVSLPPAILGHAHPHLVLHGVRCAADRCEDRPGRPVWGLGAALTAFGIYAVTNARIWLAIAQLTGFLNLFNLIPVWQLDGSRGLHVLARWERWALVAAIALALMLTEQRLLFIVGGVAVWRSLQREAGPGDTRVLATFVVLVIALSLLARGVG